VNRFFSVVVLSWFCVITVRATDERIFIGAEINGKPVRFAFDTGTGIPFLLYSTSVEKFGLKITQPPQEIQPGPGQVVGGWTEPARLNLGMTNVETQFGVVQIPAYAKWPEEGMLGWPAISNNIFSIDCVSHRIFVLTNVLEASNGWVEFPVRTIEGDLTLEFPGEQGIKKIVALDTGDSYGVELSLQEWRQWKIHHTNQPTSISARLTLNSELLVSEEMWAQKIALGPLVLTDVSVMEADPKLDGLCHSAETQYEATLGFAALKRLEVIIDGKRGIAYLRPKPTPPLPYEHNRLGAVFVPLGLQSNDLVAHVVVGSPAYEAGIRNDDLLQKIGTLDVTQWRTDTNVLPLSRFWDSPAGTKLKLTVKRGDKIIETTAVLRNILPPDTLKNSN